MALREGLVHVIRQLAQGIRGLQRFGEEKHQVLGGLAIERDEDRPDADEEAALRGGDLQDRLSRARRLVSVVRQGIPEGTFGPARPGNRPLGPARTGAGSCQGFASVAQVLGATRPFLTPVMIPLTIVDWLWAPLVRSKSANELVPEPPLSHQTGMSPAVVVSWA